MATTLIDAVVDGLVTTLRAAADLDAPGGANTPVFDGPTVTDANDRDYVTVGWTDGGAAATSVQDHHDIGYTTSSQRDDNGQVAVVVSCWDGDADIAATRARAFVILGHVETAIRNTPDLGVTNLLWSHVTGVQMTQQLGADGCVVELEVTVTYRGLI